MQYDEIYKGYRIKFRQMSGLAAVIWPPNSGLALSEFPEATREEGMNVLRVRTHAVIDADITKAAEMQNKK